MWTSLSRKWNPLGADVVAGPAVMVTVPPVGVCTDDCSVSAVVAPVEFGSVVTVCPGPTVLLTVVGAFFNVTRPRPGSPSVAFTATEDVGATQKSAPRPGRAAPCSGIAGSPRTDTASPGTPFKVKHSRNFPTLHVSPGAGQSRS